VTNQSGIARGLYSEADFRSVQQRLADLLAAEGVYLDGVYFCPHHPDCDGACDCRKPGTALYLRAAREHGIDLTRSIFTGDRLKDIEPATSLGGRGILVLTGYGAEQARGYTGEVVADLAAVAAAVLRDDPDL
jgi:D-glycero-D-manno-heptose 1,7-bisphosphate phosphatase